VVCDVGLSLEPGREPSPDAELLTAGSTYSLRAGILLPGEAAIVSATVAITADGADVLWATPD
jgi:hypothetical protein